MAEGTKLSVSLSKPAMDALRQLATSHDVTLSAALGQAISDAKYFQDAVDRDGKVLIEDKSGDLRRVVIPRSVRRSSNGS